jgi:hypothetical protein
LNADHESAVASAATSALSTLAPPRNRDSICTRVMGRLIARTTWDTPKWTPGQETNACKTNASAANAFAARHRRRRRR